MADIVRSRSFFRRKVAIVIARRALVIEDISVSCGLIEVDGMRPRIRDRRLKSPAYRLFTWMANPS